MNNVHLRELYEANFGKLPEFKFSFKTFPILKSGPYRGLTSAQSAKSSIQDWFFERRDLLEEIKSKTGALGKLFLPKAQAAYKPSHRINGKVAVNMIKTVRPFGRLALKSEPGKFRVFAMVDSMNQWLLRPFHDYLFKILSNLGRVDGTFKHRIAAEEVAALGKREIFSFDLSKATDRLPLQLQEAVVQQITGLGSIWRKLIVDSEFAIPSCSVWTDNGYPLNTVKYSVGQPMGALSSWAALAVTHHYLVQVATESVGIKTWFRDYCIIGDDIVIFNKEVAQAYKTLMGRIGVPINMVKSIVSRNGTFEFAKRVFWKGYDVSAVPVRLLDTTRIELSSLQTLMLSELKRFPHMREPRHLVGMRGRGYRTKAHLYDYLWRLSKGVRNTLLFATLPNSFYALPSWPDWFNQVSFRNPLDVDGFQRQREWLWSRVQTLVLSSDMKTYRHWMEYRGRLKDHPIDPFDDAVVRWKQDEAQNYFRWLDQKSDLKKWFEEHSGETQDEIHQGFVLFGDALLSQTRLKKGLNLGREKPKELTLGYWVKMYTKVGMLPIIRSLFEA